MGLFDFVKKGAQEMFIARPDEAKDLIVYKWPDRTIPMKAQITVGQDECALFYKDGKFVGRLDAGRHTLETQNIPFLSVLMDKFTSGNVLMAEVWFIQLREVGGIQFGGRIGDVEDPKSGMAIGTMVHGDFSIQVEDPMKVIGFFGQRSWSSDDEFTGWFKNQLLKVIRDRIAEMMVKQNIPLLHVTSGALTEEIEQLVIAGTKPHLESYGMKVVRMGNFVVAIKEEDEVQLKQLYKDAAQIRMAGGMQGFQQLAAGKAMMGAGEGMAKGGGDGGGSNPMLGGAGLGVGMGMAAMFQQNANQQNQQPQAPQQPTAPAGGVGQVTCGKCGQKTAPGKFCAECGEALAEKKAFCSECGKPMNPGTKFCGECGAKQGG
ncbi:MAG: Antifreeze protein [Myxococcales bacterium]|nr:Antifreeze protein [Myxococcales bacterium]